MKKSLVEAIEQARRMSEEHPDMIYYVMDKPRHHAACHGSYWVVKEKILAGWSVYCRFQNGKELRT